jgi:ParB family chromosome partitioning protein
MKTKHELVDCDRIKIFVHRDRDRERFEAMKASIADRGLKQPIQVRDITQWPEEERKRPEGGLYHYGIITGEGRLTAFRELGKKQIPAYVVAKTSDAETVGMFLAENLNRDPLPWVHKAKLMKAAIDSGETPEEIGKRFFVSPRHVQKCAHILGRTAKGLEEAVEAMTIADAEALTSLKPEEQRIVIEVAHEIKATGQVKELVKQAKELADKEEGEGLSALGLKRSLERLGEELKRVRSELKPLRLHYAIGPANIRHLLKDAKIRKALDAEKVNYSKFI